MHGLTNIFQNQKGFSLIQALVMVVIATTSSIFLATKGNIVEKTIRGIYLSKELYIFTERIQEYFVDSRVCDAAFGSRPADFNNYVDPITVDGNELISLGKIIGFNHFQVTGMRLTTIDTGFVRFAYTVQTRAEKEGEAFFPQEVEKSIHLFANIDGAGIIQDCYFDPLDSDYTDTTADGIVSQAITKVCNTVPGAVGATLDTTTMNCHVPGFNPSALTSGGAGQIADGVSFQPDDDGRMILVANYVTNPYWLPGKTCGPGQFMTGVSLQGSEFQPDCAPIAKDDFDHLMDLSPQTCNQQAQGGGIHLTNYNGMIQLRCN